MTEPTAAPHIDETLSRVRGRERRRIRISALVRWTWALLAAVVLLAAWRIADRVLGREPLPVAWSLGLLGLVAASGVAAWALATIRRDDESIARDVDRRLGLDDRVAAALAVSRGRAAGGLAALVVRDADAALAASAVRVDDAFPVRPAAPLRRHVRRSAWVAAAVVVLAALAELLTVGGPFRLLPGAHGPGGAPDADSPPTAASPPREEGGGTPEEKERPAKPKPASPAKEPKEPAPPGDVRVSVRLPKEEFDADEAVTATVSAAPTGELGGPRTFDVRAGVEGTGGPDADTGVVMSVSSAAPAGASADVDLRQVPGLTLAPGEHFAVARLTTRDSHEEHVSAPVRFVVRPPKKDGGGDDGKGGKPPPKPEPPKTPPPPQPQPPPTSGKPKDEQPAGPAPEVPPPTFERHAVMPLFGKGEEVEKHGPVLVLDPGGGPDVPAERRPVESALDGARRRAEDAVDRARLSAADRELVRRYFELLERLGR